MTMELQCFFFNWKIAIGHWPKDQLVVFHSRAGTRRERTRGEAVLAGGT